MIKMKYILLIGILLFVGCDKCTETAETLNWAYCDHMGYERRIVDGDYTKTGLVCIFDDNTSCNTWDFYYGDCGQDKIRPIPNRQKCEAIYPQFDEKCDEGLAPKEADWILGVPYCYPIGIGHPYPRNQLLVDQPKYKE